MKRENEPFSYLREVTSSQLVMEMKLTSGDSSQCGDEMMRTSSCSGRGHRERHFFSFLAPIYSFLFHLTLATSLR